MTKPPREKPPAKPDRLAREAAALRANLLKRKEQTRQRDAERAKPVEDPSSSETTRTDP